MSKRRRRIDKGKLRKLVIIAIIAIALIVIYNFSFLTKSETTAPTVVATFTEYGLSNEFSADLEMHQDETGNYYVVLPDKVQNAYSKTFYKSTPTANEGVSPLSLDDTVENTSLQNEITNTENNASIENITVDNVNTNNIVTSQTENTNTSKTNQTSTYSVKNVENENNNTIADVQTNTVKEIANSNKVSTENVVENDTIQNTIAAISEVEGEENIVSYSARALQNTNTISEDNTNTVSKEISNASNTNVIAKNLTNTTENTNTLNENANTNTIIANNVSDNTVNSNTVTENDTNVNNTANTNVANANTANTNTVNTNSINTNTINNNTINSNIIINNTITNTASNNTTNSNENVLQNNTVSDNTNSIVDNKVIEMPEIDATNQPMLMSTMPQATTETVTVYQPNTKYYLTEEEIANKTLSMDVAFETTELNGVKLYKQELISSIDGTEIKVVGFIPLSYQLSLTAVEKSVIEENISDVEEFENAEILMSNDISITDGNGNVFQPKNYGLTVDVTFKSQTNFEGKISDNSVRILHIKEVTESDTGDITVNIEKVTSSDITSDSITFVTNEFSPYAILAYPPILPDSITIDDYDSDYNYYMGKNYTDTIYGVNLGTYTADKMAKVTINYYGYNPQFTETQLKTTVSSWTTSGTTRQNNYIDEDGSSITIYRSTITATVDTSGNGFINEDDAWQMTFSIPTGTRLVQQYLEDQNTTNINAVVHDVTNNKVTISNSSLANWTENSSTSYTISFSIAFTTNVTVSNPGTVEFVAYQRPLRGYVSADEGERQSLFTYIKAIPIDKNGNISFELIDNPYMDRPKGAGFDGWKTYESAHTISFNDLTKMQTLTTSMNGGKEITINLYANWVEANIMFVSSNGAAANSGYNITVPKQTTDQIAGILDDNYKYATNASDRELNIIVITNGDYEVFDNLTDTYLAFTLTSLYDGVDYRTSSSCVCDTGNLVIYNDLQLHHLNWGRNNIYYNNNGNNNINYRITGNTYNLRIGRGMTPLDNNSGTFSQVQGGPSSVTRSAYRLVVESGKYINIQLGRAYGYETGYSSSGTLVYGCDYDRISGNNENLKIYMRTSAKTGPNVTSPGVDGQPVHFLNIKSGSIGMENFTNRGGSYEYSGIYVSGVGYADDDTGDRVLLVEGGDVANIIGGLATSSGTTVLTKIYVKGGSVQNIVGGAGLTQTYGDRIIQVTGGSIAYSVSGGSNGYAATTNNEGGDNGKLNGNSLIYIGGDAVVGTQPTTASLYNVYAGNVLGAGNGAERYKTYSGLVFSSHVIIDGNAKVNNCVYGGGNFGRVDGGMTLSNIKYTPVSSFEANTPYVISSGSGGGYAFTANGTNIANYTQVPTEDVPSENSIWYLEDAGNGRVYIRNSAGVYIAGSANGNLSLVTARNSARAFSIAQYGNSVRLYYTGNYNRTYNLRCNNGEWSLYRWGTTTVYLLKYEEIVLPDGIDVTNIAKVDVFGGTVAYDVYSGANDNSIAGPTKVTMTGGNVNGAVYGGSNTSGTIEGDSTVNISGGNIGTATLNTDAVFGGGKGTDTSMDYTTNVSITDANNNVNIYGNIYGGSALGHVTGNASVTVEDKTSSTNSIFISGSIFGGGKGETGDAATNGGNTTVIVDGGSYGNAKAFGGCNVNGTIEGAILVKIGETANTYIDEVYGGGNEAVVTTATDNVYAYLYDNATVNNAFNGGNSAGIDGDIPRAIYVQGATVTQAVFGGSNTSGTLNNTFVYCSDEASVANVYGGGKGINTVITADTLVDIKNSTITNNTYGGGDQGTVNGSTVVKINTSEVGNTVYGGGNGANTSDDENISPGEVGGTTSVTIESSAVKNEVFGGGKGVTATTSGDTTISIKSSEVYDENSSTAGNVYGGGDLGEVLGTTNVTITESKIGNTVYGGGNGTVPENIADLIDENAKPGAVTGSTSVAITENSEAKIVYGGGNKGAVGNDTTISTATVSINDSYIKDTVYGGGNEGAISGNTTVTITTSDVTNSVFGGGKAANVNGTTVTINLESETGYVYGGGDQGEVITSTNVVVSDSTINNNIYGGGNGAQTRVNTTVPGKVGENTTVKVTNSSAYQIFGGGRGETALVTGNADLLIEENTQVTDDIYGGGDRGQVNGSTQVGISSSSIGGNAYAAGNGSTAIVAGNSYIYVEGTTTIGKSLFGGGNAAPTGDGIQDVSAIVDVAGAVIGGNVYGGANSSVIYGDTVVNIGNQAINDYYGLDADRFEIGKIDIAGTIFGGGEQMVPGKDYSFDSISVEGTILINVDGQGYDVGDNTIYFHESIFGSGNASSARTNGDINIKNYGTADNPKKGISLQRAGIIEIYNSSIALNGTTDSTSLHPDEYFTLNIIADLKIVNNTTLYLRNGANLVAEFESLYENDAGTEEPAKVEIVDTVTDSNGNTYESINGKIYDGNDVKYYIEASVIYDAEDDTEVSTVATVESATSITRNVDNRIYMYSGINLNLANDENLKEAFSSVTGMTYFGLYKSTASEDGSGTDLYLGMYDKDYPVGQEGDAGVAWIDREYNRSYVLGLHKTDPEHDIVADGFYTTYERFAIPVEVDEVLTEENYASHEPSTYISYITPTPEKALHYMWHAGPDQEIYYYTFNLIASKHSTLGTAELSLLDLSYPNAVLTIDEDKIESSLVDGVGLYDKNTIPNINENIDEANNNFGITMKSGNSGWSMVGSTDFYSDPNTGTVSCDGTKVYTIENSTTTPTLNFYFYHSNNLTESRELGYYTITMELLYWKDSLNMVPATVIIDIALSSEVYDDLGYNGAIAPGSQYDLFTNTPTNVTTESSFTTYFELAQDKFYENEGVANWYDSSYRVITTEYAFPTNTTITMIDRYDKNNPQYYYYIVSEDDYDEGKNEYEFTEFLAMGSTDRTYDEIEARNNYYIESIDYQYENFIFIVNFENAEFEGIDENTVEIIKNQHFRIYLKALVDNREEILFGLLDDQIEKLTYGIYNAESTIDIEASLSKPKIYLGNEVYLNIDTQYNVTNLDSVRVYDTRYFDKKLGVKLTFFKKKINGIGQDDDGDGTIDEADEDNIYEVVTGANLLGTYFELNGIKYYPRADGTTRIKVAELVSNASSQIRIGTENSSIVTGEYKILVESFGSADGIYFGIEASASDEVYMEIINDVYGLDVTLPEEQAIIDKTTGFTLDKSEERLGYTSEGNNTLNFDVRYVSGLNNPYITVSLYRRNYDEQNPYDRTYSKVDFQDYVQETLEEPLEINKDDYSESDYEFIDSVKVFNQEYKAYDTTEIMSKVGNNTVAVDLDKLTYTLKENLTTGTYKVVFTLYDTNNTIIENIVQDEDSGDNIALQYNRREYEPIGDSFAYIIIK